MNNDTRFKYKSEHFKDIHTARSVLRTEISGIGNELISLGIDYSNYITGSFNEEIFYKIRDGINARLDACLFHLDLLLMVNKPGTKYAYSFDGPKVDGFYIARDQGYIFDSITFHSTSTLDFLASLVKYILEKDKNRWRSTWKGLQKFLKSDRHLRASILFGKIKILNNAYVNTLIEYRAHGFQYLIDSATYKQTDDLFHGLTDLYIYAPSNFYKRFRKMITVDHDEVDIIRAACWVLTSVTKVIGEIIAELRLYLKEHRRTDEGQEVFKFSSSEEE